MRRLFIAVVFLSTPLYAVVFDIGSHCSQAIERISRQAKFVQVDNLIQEETVKERLVTNLRPEVKTLILDGGDVLQTLQAFQVPLMGFESPSHEVLLQGTLKYLTSQQNPGGRLHVFKVDVDADLTILGILKEKTAPKGLRVKELTLRFSRIADGKYVFVDIPLIYQSSNQYQTMDRNLIIKDSGRKHRYSAQFLVFEESGKNLASGSYAEINSSNNYKDPDNAIKFKLFIKKDLI